MCTKNTYYSNVITNDSEDWPLYSGYCIIYWFLYKNYVLTFILIPKVYIHLQHVKRKAAFEFSRLKFFKILFKSWTCGIKLSIGKCNWPLHHGWGYFYCSFPWINCHEPTVKEPTHGVSYLNHSNPLFHVQLTPSLTSFALGVNWPETLGSMWFKSFVMK